MGYNEFVEVNCDFNVQLVTTHTSVTRADGTHQHCIKVSIFRDMLVRIFPHSDWIRSDTYSIRRRENTDQNNSESGYLLRIGILDYDFFFLAIWSLLSISSSDPECMQNILINLSENYGTLIPIVGKEGISFTAWKWSKYGVFSGPYFPVFSPNTGKYGPEKLRIWTLSTQCFIIFLTWTVPNINLEAVGNAKAVLKCNIHSKYATSNTIEV